MNAMDIPADENAIRPELSARLWAVLGDATQQWSAHPYDVLIVLYTMAVQVACVMARTRADDLQFFLSVHHQAEQAVLLDLDVAPDTATIAH